jgi:hypothetical protein
VVTEFAHHAKVEDVQYDGVVGTDLFNECFARSADTATFDLEVVSE